MAQGSSTSYESGRVRIGSQRSYIVTPESTFGQLLGRDLRDVFPGVTFIFPDPLHVGVPSHGSPTIKSKLEKSRAIGREIAEYLFAKYGHKKNDGGPYDEYVRYMSVPDTTSRALGPELSKDTRVAPFIKRAIAVFGEVSTLASLQREYPDECLSKIIALSRESGAQPTAYTAYGSTGAFGSCQSVIATSGALMYTSTGLLQDRTITGFEITVRRKLTAELERLFKVPLLDMNVRDACRALTIPHIAVLHSLLHAAASVKLAAAGSGAEVSQKGLVVAPSALGTGFFHVAYWAPGYAKQTLKASGRSRLHLTDLPIVLADFVRRGVTIGTTSEMVSVFGTVATGLKAITI